MAVLLALVHVAVYFQKRFDWDGYETGRLEEEPIPDEPSASATDND